MEVDSGPDQEPVDSEAVGSHKQGRRPSLRRYLSKIGIFPFSKSPCTVFNRGLEVDTGPRFTDNPALTSPEHYNE